MTTLELLKQYLQNYFIEHQPRKILPLLTDDIHCYGFAENRVIENLTQGIEMMESEIYKKFMDYELRFLTDKEISEDSAMIEYTLTHENVSIRYRLIGNSRITGQGRKLYLLNFGMINPNQTLTMFEDVLNHRKIEQEELRQNKRITELAAEFANIWVVTYDTKKEICYPDERLIRQFSFPEELHDFPESIFKYQLILPQYVDLYRDSFRRLQRGEQEIDFDIQTKYPDGSVHWIRFRGQRLPEGTGNGINAVISAQEVDAEKAMEARILMEEKQQSEGDSNLLAHFITNLSRDLPVEHSYHFQEREELQVWESIEKQLSCTEKYVIRPEKREQFRRIHNTRYLLEQYAKGITEETLEYRRMFPDGKIVWVRSVLHLIRDPKTGDLFNYEYLYDIHAQRISDELMTSVVALGFERCASLMVDTNQVTILRSDKEPQEEHLEITDYSKVNEEYAMCWVLPEDRDVYLENCALANIRTRLKEEEYFETTHRTLENGEIRYKKDQCYRYDKEPNVCLLIRSDMTDVVLREQKKRLRLQNALQAAEAATEAKSEFLSRMSHEIRTPMNAIMGMTAIARNEQQDSVQVADCLNKIDMSSRYLLTLINDILDMSRIESGKLNVKHREFSFDQLLDGIYTMVHPLAEKNEIRFEFIHNGLKNQYYLGDMVRIQQVVVNLLANALKFTKPQGRVRFQANIEKKEKEITWYRFTVEDTGIGMSEEFMEHIFQPFVQEDSGNTSEYEGSGLGLAISKSLTEAMGGRIRVESFQNIGSTFTVELPLGDVEAKNRIWEPFGNEDEDSTEYLKGCSVLLAEDHPMNVMVARKLLEKKEVNVTVAENGKKALDIFSESPIHSFDLILMDIRMPVMDGLDAARAIRALEREDARTIPIIAMTANALEEDRQKSQEAGMNEHLGKPIEPYVLYRIMNRILRNHDRQR